MRKQVPGVRFQVSGARCQVLGVRSLGRVKKVLVCNAAEDRLKGVLGEHDIEV